MTPSAKPPVVSTGGNPILDNLLAEFANKLQQTLNNLEALSEGLEKGQGTAGMLFKDPALYNNSNQMLVEARELVKSIRENPKKYLVIHLKLF